MDKACVNIQSLNGYFDADTLKHCLGVSALSLMLCRKLEVSLDDTDLVYISARVHDIGKYFISERVLRKPGKLLKSEWGAISDHAEYGYLLLKELGFNDNICQMVYAHHGLHNVKYKYSLHVEISQKVFNLYPILMICDIIDAMLNKRCYRKINYSIDDVFSEIRKLNEVPSSMLEVTREFITDRWEKGII